MVIITSTRTPEELGHTAPGDDGHQPVLELPSPGRDGGVAKENDLGGEQVEEDHGLVEDEASGQVATDKILGSLVLSGELQIVCREGLQGEFSGSI